MIDSEKNISYFLGANTPNGFVSLFNELYNPYDNWKVYIIKGGPGTGKSGLMKKVASEIENSGEQVERIYCSSDPASLDAIRIPKIKVCIVDGTSPHVMEPKFPGIVEEIVNLGDFWDSEKLRKNSELIRSISIKNTSLHKKAAKFLKAAYIFKEDTKSLTSKYINENKIKNFALRFSSRMIPSVYGKVGHEQKRFISAITPDGVVFKHENIDALCDTVIEIEDNYNVLSDLLLKKIKEQAISKGHDVISCLCPMAKDEQIEHLIIPDIGLAVCTYNKNNKLPFNAKQRVCSSRFIDMQGLKKVKNRIKFNETASKELIDEAVNLLKNAKETHDKIESYYIDAMNFDGVNKKTEEIISQIKKLLA